jgi:DNA-binding transcriptional LysR family regulator
LSYTVERLETRLRPSALESHDAQHGYTEGGERLLRTLRPAFDLNDAELDVVSELRDKSAGTIRITAIDHLADTIRWRVIARLPPDEPDIKVEIDIDYGITAIVADRYDAGVRLR